jgi:hypothetical protein
MYMFWLDRRGEVRKRQKFRVRHGLAVAVTLRARGYHRGAGKRRADCPLRITPGCFHGLALQRSSIASPYNALSMASPYNGSFCT